MRHVRPHEEVVPHHERQGQHLAHERLGGVLALGLYGEPLPGALRARQPGILRGEAPFRHDDGLSRPRLQFRQHGAHVVVLAVGRAADRDRAVSSEVDGGIDVHGHDVAMPPGGFPHHGMRPVEAREAAAHHKVVRIGGADRRRRGGKVAVGDHGKEVDLHRLGDVAGDAARREKRLQRPTRRVRGRQGGHGVDERRAVAYGHELSALLPKSPPREFVVDEVANEVAVVRMRAARLFRHLATEVGELRTEDVRERAARPAEVRADVVVRVALPCGGRGPHAQENRVAQAAMPGRMGGVAAERVEAPRLEARHRCRLPRAGRDVFHLGRLPVGVLPRHVVARSARTHPAHAHLKRPVARAVHQPPAPLSVTRRRHESGSG